MWPFRQRRLGERGERVARRFLRQQGLKVVACNVRLPAGELDIVAADGPTICFVEVKTRSGVGAGAPFEAVTLAKQRKLSVLARQYVARHHLHDRPARFDVVAVTWQPDVSDPQIEYFPNAFPLYEGPGR